MQCYACENEAREQCPRCANPYCDDHGTQLCARCEDPVLATPSATVFRVALIGLVFAGVLALWLLVRPPDMPEGSPGAVRPVVTEPAEDDGPTPTPAQPTATVPPAETEAPSPTPQPPTATPEPTAEPTPEPTPEPTDIEYVVVEGDTWYGIAEAFGVNAEALAAYNGYTLDDVLTIGQTIVIPQ